MHGLHALTVVALVLLVRNVEADACGLLTRAEVSKALEIESLDGRRIVESSPKACIWSDDAKAASSNRRVTVQYTTIAGFQMGKSGSGAFPIETVSGVGDEAYYEIIKSESPILVVRKGNTAIGVRILNGLKFKAFTLEQEKAKEAELAKAAVGRL